MRRDLLRLVAVGARRPAAAAGRLDLLADPRRPRRRQDPRRRRGGARMGEELRHRQPDRRDPRRRARRDGAGRIRIDGGLPARRTAALRARGGPARLAERRGVAAVLGRGAGPAARQAAFGASVQDLSTCEAYPFTPLGVGVGAPIAAQLAGGVPLDLGAVAAAPALADDFGALVGAVSGALDLGLA